MSEHPRGTLTLALSPAGERGFVVAQPPGGFHSLSPSTGSGQALARERVGVRVVRPEGGR